MKNFILIVLSILTITSCTQKKQAQHTPPTFTGAVGEVKLITLDPGHFHAALIQKTSYNQISKDVYVYSPGGEDLKEHLARIDAYNARPNTPTDWNEIVYVGADFLEKMQSYLKNASQKNKWRFFGRFIKDKESNILTKKIIIVFSVDRKSVV